MFDNGTVPEEIRFFLCFGFFLLSFLSLFHHCLGSCMFQFRLGFGFTCRWSACEDLRAILISNRNPALPYTLHMVQDSRFYPCFLYTCHLSMSSSDPYEMKIRFPDPQIYTSLVYVIRLPIAFSLFVARETKWRFFGGRLRQPWPIRSFEQSTI